MPPARKGLQDIKTHAGRPTAPGSNHRTYIRLSTLEMERMRRQQEFEAAQARADAARSRVERLDAEIAELIALIARATGTRGPAPKAEQPPPAGAIAHSYGARAPIRQAKPAGAIEPKAPIAEKPTAETPTVKSSRSKKGSTR